ncbi:MAG: Rrf2 family transcriptional regulator [Candidatus Omnitrophica bacterium]|nr:Rrf2 family transcriptional regulator [Candidatus Omnitrophota bacterium]
MKLIKRDTDYAVRALCYFANQKKRVVNSDELVKRLKMPRPYMRKILQQLGRSGMLLSVKGQAGGFILSRSLDHINLSDLINLFQGPTQLSDHLLKKKPCPELKNCRLKKKLDRIENLIVSVLKSTKISSLLK